MTKGPTRSTGINLANMGDHPRVGRSAGLNAKKTMSDNAHPSSPYTTGKSTTKDMGTRTGDAPASGSQKGTMPRQAVTKSGASYRKLSQGQ